MIMQIQAYIGNDHAETDYDNAETRYTIYDNAKTGYDNIEKIIYKLCPHYVGEEFPYRMKNLRLTHGLFNKKNIS